MCGLDKTVALAVFGAVAKKPNARIFYAERDVRIVCAQNGVVDKAFGLTGMIVTKLDGTGKGGAVAGIYRTLKIPILCVGLGEKTEDLQDFDVRAYSRGVFGLE